MVNVMKTTADPTDLPQNWDRRGLPAWSFFNPELLELEKDVLFRSHWQLACHVSDISGAGDFLTFDLVGERALILRGKDGVVRAFHNLCRHRGSRVVAESQGSCRAIICPFHGWVYNLDGTLRGPAEPKSLPDLDPVKWGLKPIDMDIWQGFVFVRFKPGPQPPMSQLMAQFDAEVAQYDLQNLRPTGEGFYLEEIEANWKCVRDVDNEGYHVPMAHPGLQDLYGPNYFDEPFRRGAARSFAPFRDGPGRLWSVRAYKAMLDPPARLDDDHKHAWLYIGMFPNAVFGLYPDSVIFYQEFPVENGRTIQRSVTYRYANEDRRMRLARYLSGRIDRLTSDEDVQLIKWTWEAAFSSGYEGYLLSDLEFGVRSYHDILRTFFPVLNGDEPEKGTLGERNAAMLATLPPS